MNWLKNVRYGFSNLKVIGFPSKKVITRGSQKKDIPNPNIEKKEKKHLILSVFSTILYKRIQPNINVIHPNKFEKSGKTKISKIVKTDRVNITVLYH